MNTKQIDCAKDAYMSPSCEAVDVNALQVICSSIKNGIDNWQSDGDALFC